MILAEWRMDQWVSSSFKSKNSVKLVKSGTALKLTGMTSLVGLLHFSVFELLLSQVDSVKS